MAKILIVEDEANLMGLYSSEFQKEGYDVITAGDGIEAINKAKDHSPDLVILDIKIPKLDGMSTMRQILEFNKDLPVIINSAYSSFKDDFTSWAAKAYIIKSGDLTELKAKVAELLQN